MFGAGGLQVQEVRFRRRTTIAAASVLEPTVHLQTRHNQAEHPVDMPAEGNAALLPSAAALLTRLSSYCYQHAPSPGMWGKSPQSTHWVAGLVTIGCRVVGKRGSNLNEKSMLAYSSSTSSLFSADDERSQQGPVCGAEQLFKLLEHMHLDAATEVPSKPAVQPTGASPASPVLRPYHMVNPWKRQIRLAPEEAALKEGLASTPIRKTTAEPLETQPKWQLRPAVQPTSATEGAIASAKSVLQPTNVWHKSQNMSQPAQLTDSSTTGVKSMANSPAQSAKPAWQKSRKGAAGARGGQEHVAQSQIPKVPPGKSTKSSDSTKTCVHIWKEPMQRSDRRPDAASGQSSRTSAAVAAASGRLGSAPGCRPAASSAHSGKPSADRATKPVRSMDARDLPFQCEKASLAAAHARHPLARQHCPAPRQPAGTPPDSSHCQPTEQLPSCTTPSSPSQAWQATAFGCKDDPEAGSTGEPGLGIADPVIDDILAGIPEKDWPSYLECIEWVAAGSTPYGSSQLASGEAAEQPESAGIGNLPLETVACAGMKSSNHLITRPRLSPPDHSLPRAFQEPYDSKASAGPAVTAGTVPQGEPQQSSSQQQAASAAWRTAELQEEPLQEPTAAAAELHAGRTVGLSEQPEGRLGSFGGEQSGNPHDSMRLGLEGAIDRMQQVQTCADSRLLTGDARRRKDDLLEAVAKESLPEQGSGTAAALNRQNASQEASLAMLAGTNGSSLKCPGRASQQDAGMAADTDL